MSQANERKPNRLIHATSPYLLQHAYNPVAWFEWSDEALARAKDLDVPILVSIGYSSCHWCHVMERESFENEQIATLMNEHFVCIKVDREERPDIDQVHMDAIQAMGMNGGWPLNVFLTSDQKPFFGGTYFNPQNWVNLLQNISGAYQSRRNEIESTSEELARHLQNSNLDRLIETSNSSFEEDLDGMFEKLKSKFDLQWGGLDRAPKFIMPSIWHWLLRYWSITGKTEALSHVVFTLKQIASGGIYDQVGGGFARYSVDEAWFAPHFEKMLYDNAQLMSLYSEAYKATGESLFREIVHETFRWLKREMTGDDHGFYSALDADSEGIEGKFYTWTKEEFLALLPNDGELVGKYFGIKPSGNWEHRRNILTSRTSMEEFAASNNISNDELIKRITNARHLLLQARNNRIKPGLDDKVLTGWNAMMIIGLLDAHDAFGDPAFRESAYQNIEFILKEVSDGNQLFRSYRKKRSLVEGFLEDYAFVIKALIKLYQSDFNEDWLTKAKSMTKYVMDNFFDEQEGYFHFTSHKAEKLVARRKELFDNVIPSSNSVMAQNLHWLGVIFDNNTWKDTASQMVSKLSGVIASEPVYMSNWGIVSMEMNHGLAEVAITGSEAQTLGGEFRSKFKPFSILMGSEKESNLPLLQGKSNPERSTIYVCYDKTCKLPVHSVKDALAQLR